MPMHARGLRLLARECVSLPHGRGSPGPCGPRPACPRGWIAIVGRGCVSLPHGRGSPGCPFGTDRPSDVLALVIQHIGHRVDDVLLIPQKTRASMTRPHFVGGSHQSQGPELPGPIGLESGHHIDDRGIARHYRMDVIGAHIQGVKPPIPKAANLGDGRRNGPAPGLIEANGVLGHAFARVGLSHGIRRERGCTNEVVAPVDTSPKVAVEPRPVGREREEVSGRPTHAGILAEASYASPDRREGHELDAHPRR